MCVGVTLWFGWGGVVSVCRLQPAYGDHTTYIGRYIKLRMFENMVLRKVFESKGYLVTGEWRILHNQELYDVYSSPNNIRLIKSSRIRWEGHVARMGKRKGAYRILVGRRGKATT